MKTKQDVEKGLYELFSQFVHRSVTDNFFIGKLNALCKGSKGQSWWWRYYPDDTLANTPSSTKQWLSSTSRNRVSVLEDMQYALDNKSLILYYS